MAVLREQIKNNPPPGWKKEFVDLKSNLDLICRILEKPENRNHAPPQEEIMTSFYECPLQNVRVLILGERPYPTFFPDGVSEACGPAFCGRRGYRIPGSLANIFNELNRQYPDLPIQKDGDLRPWLRQGVFLLNTVMTYHPNKQEIGFWIGFVEKIIGKIINSNPNLIICLWGKVAKDFVAGDLMKSIQGNKNVRVLECGHPSSRNRLNSFEGNGHFLEINRILSELGQTQINWDITTAVSIAT